MPEEPPPPEPIEPPDNATEMPEVQRRAMEPIASTPHTEESADPFPDVFDAPDDVQRLADIPTLTDTAEALADNRDATDGASNETPTPKPKHETGPQNEDIPLVPVSVASANSSAGSSAPTPAVAAKRPGDGRDLPAAYRARVASDRDAILAENGGNAHTEAAVQAALNWLAQNQQSDGDGTAQHTAVGEKRESWGMTEAVPERKQIPRSRAWQSWRSWEPDTLTWMATINKTSNMPWSFSFTSRPGMVTWPATHAHLPACIAMGWRHWHLAKLTL